MPAAPSFRLRGTASTTTPPVTDKEVVVRSALRIVPGSARSAADDAAQMPPDAVVRVELENGFVLWSRADDLIRERGQRVVDRDGGESWEISMAPRPGSRAATASRGWLGLGVKVLEFFGIDIKRRAVSKLSEKLEEKLLRSNPPGVYRVGLGDGDGPVLNALADDDSIAADQGPLLILLHGTGSSTDGSFGKLWDGDNRSGAATRAKLAETYGERVLALEHRSLTESPVENALALARRLPAGAELHLVSHSRGGLIGELMCLGMRDRSNDALDDALLDELFAADRTMAEQLGISPLDKAAAKERDKAYADDRKRLAELRDELDAKRPRVRRFVRVACPARGTTLASGRLDRWLSVLDFLAGATIVGDALDFMMAVVKERTDPRTLPGLEAMMPGSALTRLLQHPGLEVDADLSVIAGDIEGHSLWSQIKLLASDWFYGSEHDLVVNTGSMSGGLRRSPGSARLLCDKGAEVNHFHYFANERSVKWLLAGLTRAADSDGGFRPIGEASHEPPRWRAALRQSRAASAPRPLAVVLPGTMGSMLQARGETVWLNYWRLARGGLKRLRMGQAEIEPVDLVGDFYGPLIEFLARSHRVEILPYDWRMSILEAASRLAERLEALVPEAERSGQPVHLVAHSMGGLVVRAMIADGGPGAAIWARIKALPNSRFMMLGTPNKGSHEAVRWLTGGNPTQLKLALLDLTQNTGDIIDIVRQYPGLIELLPFAPDGTDFSDPALWKRLRAELDAVWKPAPTTALRGARATWQRLLEAEPDPEHMIYIAGCQPATVVDYRTESSDSLLGGSSRKLAFDATARGDGTVSWDSGLLPGVPAWYVEDTAHDKLCAQQRAFPGYLDLLTTGTTARLPSSPPISRAAGAAQDERFALPDHPFADAIPDPETVHRLGFGPAADWQEDAETHAAPAIRVGIRHGDLGYARHPVLVGHYTGDTIVSAEAALDQHLGGALSRRLQLGLYPAAHGSHALFFHDHPDGKPGGAVVVGLGQVGELSPGLLEAGVRKAFLEYALQVAQWPDELRFGPSTKPRSAALSCLLVGSGAGGIPVAGSIEAILRAAVSASRRLVERKLDNRVVIDQIEFVELYEDIAITAAGALDTAMRDGELAGHVSWDEREILPGQGGRRRVRFEEPPDWWHRLEIIQDEKRQALRFVFSTDRARAEETLVAGQLSLADAFIDQASSSPSANAEVAKTLFEMLLPNRLKEMAPRQANMVLLVDACSARYPWELLEDRWSASGRPPAIAGGLVRQLKTPRFRPHPDHATHARAFVVGNPDLGNWATFPDLPGARQEAEKVATLLRGAGYEVRDSIDETADAVISGLHRDAWRILHLAGHGEHDFTPTRDSDRGAETLSGMVIGRDAFLTPGDVRQMRCVPELVFINCCHLGKTQSPRSGRFSELAANLAIQFVEMGVKAVIAAGWAVDDRAAHTFACSFYAHMLDGEAFGDAVRAAREESWTGFPGINTWGAYQCYGDPSYRLLGDGGAGVRRDPGPYFSPSELVADLENHRERIRVTYRDRSAEAPAWMRDLIADHLARVPERLRDDWLARADVAAAVGFAWGETGAWVEAVEWLERALIAPTGDCPVRAAEQCANFHVRIASEQWSQLRGGAVGDEDRRPLLDRIGGAIAQLDHICQRAPSAERFSLLGGACKRLAWIHTADEARARALGQMRDYYRGAMDLGDRSRPADPYPFTNWGLATALAALANKGNADDWRAPLLDQCDAMAIAASTRNEENPNIWDALGIADCELLRLIASAPRAAAARRAARRTAELYQAALSRGASPRERASVLEHLDFVIALSEGAGKATRDALASIRASL